MDSSGSDPDRPRRDRPRGAAASVGEQPDPVALAERVRELELQLEAERRKNASHLEGYQRIATDLGRLAMLDFTTSLDTTGLTEEAAAVCTTIAMLGEELSFALETAEEARRVAVAANRTKSIFLANMSHELRTPLNAIIGYTEMLGDELASSQEASEWMGDLDRVRDSALLLTRIISDILDLSKIEAGHMEYTLEVLPPGDVLQEVAASVRPAVLAHGSVLTTRVETDEPVYADRVRLTQILLNLSSNAAKFTRDGTIELLVTRQASWIVFTVRDTGIGIAPEHLEALFLPFVQVGASTERGSGTGLGLTIARKMCREMNGDLLVQSALGEGSTFEVRLPVGSKAPDPGAPA